MDSKEILETFGISKNFGILLFIQSIIVIVGCFLAFQDVYNNFIVGNNLFIVIDILTLIVFIFLIYYSFIGFRKDEKYFKIAVYLYIINRICSLITILDTNLGINAFNLNLIGSIILLILLIYFACNLDNYNKAKTTILLAVLVKVIIWILMTIAFKSTLSIAVPKLILVIPIVSIALTYIARYNKEGFKQLNK